MILSTAGFWLVEILAQGAADSSAGTVPAWLDPLGKLVSFGLLQPLAYWVLTLEPVRYWTSTGLLVSTAILALNSVVAIGICRVAVRAVRGRAE